MDDRVIAPATVTVRPSSLFDAVCVALESGEFTQVRGRLFAGEGRACVWGVAHEVAWRAGLSFEGFPPLHPELVAIERSAARMLGYDCVASANDAGEHFGIIAAALRAARLEIDNREM
jgi:hypothetical protein